MRTKRDISGEDYKTAHSILDCLENEGPLSRAMVAKKLGLSRTTLTNVISPLIDRGLVVEQEEPSDPSGRGRPGIPVDLQTTRWFALGATFHSGRWVFAVTNLKGEVVLMRTATSSVGDPKAFLSSLIKGIGHMAGKFPGKLLPGVGVGAPGLVNWKTGTIIRADDLGWEQVAVGEAVENATGFAAYVVNRNRAAGIAEAKYGKGRHAPNFIYIGIGTGISAAIMLDGSLFHGSGFSAGEIGHVVVDPRGPRCGCGKRGCLQTVAAEGALVAAVEKMRAAGRVPDDSELGRLFGADGHVRGVDVLRAASNGDKVAVEGVRRMARYLGMAVGSLITAINPDKVIFGGPLMRDGCGVLLEDVRREAGAWAMEHPFAMASIECSDMDEYAGARGAACLVLRDKLELSSGD